MDINDLPDELLIVIANFCPGINVGVLCLVAKRFNRCLQHHRRKMMIIHKVRARMMSRGVFLLMRHIHYQNCRDELHFNVNYTYDGHISSYKKYRQIKSHLIDGYSNINFKTITCGGCGTKMPLDYYVYDSCSANDHQTIVEFCHKCFHNSSVIFYQRNGRLPNRRDDGFVFCATAMETSTEQLMTIPDEIRHCFNGLGGGFIQWYGM